MNKELYVSTTPHETKVALVEDDLLAEVYFERENEYTLAGSIYKGRVTRVLPGMQSAFVDIGLERDAFLYVSDFLDLQDEEDEEFADVKVTGQSLAQANGFIATEPAATDETEVEEEDETAEVEPGDIEQETAPQTDDGGARRWRGRRRRRGRRGGRDRVNLAAPEQAAEAATDETAAVVPDEEPVSEPFVEEPEYDNAFNEPAPPAELNGEPTAPAPFLLPGESLRKYNRAAGENEPEPTEPAEERQERHGFRDRDRRGGRDRGRGFRDRDRGPRGQREPREPREPEAPLPADYTPIVLPGESISRYRNVEPISLGDTSTVSEAAETGATANVAETETTPAITQQSIQAPIFSETAAAVPTVIPTESTNPVETAGPVEASTPVAPASTPEVVEQEVSAPAQALDGTPSGKSEDFSPAGFDRVVPEPGDDKKRIDRMNVANILEGDAVETSSEAAEENAQRSAAQDDASVDIDQQPEPSVQAISEAPVERGVLSASDETVERDASGSYVLEGGNVEHEELDEDETDMPTYSEHISHFHMHDIEEETLETGNGMVSETVRDSNEARVIDRDEYEFDAADEFEESEMLADSEEDEEIAEDEIGTSGRAELRAPAPNAAFQQRGERQERGERFERRGRRDRGRRGAPPRGRVRREPRVIPQISDVLKEGQEILVQIAKEPIGKKGARITSHIALPGRFLVYMPTVNHIGVSRKINSEEERQRLKRIVASERENGHGGFIVRTAAAHIKEDELRADIRFLKHLWHEIRTRAEGSKSPSLIYHDLNLVERILRDQVTSDFSQIWVDNEAEYERVVRFASRFQPSLVRRIKLYTKDVPLFEQFSIQDEINKSLKSKVWLKSGGYIVINQTEALVAIDINTGKYVGKTARLEDTIVKTNCDAIKEIVRQIRLRDLGGIIVIDFIDMDERKNRQKVMQTLEEALKADRAPSKVLQFNDFGLVAITRKRVKQSLERTLGSPCPYCTATGFVKSVTTVANEIYVEMRKVRRHIETKDVVLRVNPDVAKELKSNNGKWLAEMEELIGHTILLKSDASLHQEQFDLNF